MRTWYSSRCTYRGQRLGGCKLKIKMLETRSGFHDRFRSFKYSEGQVYDLPKSLASQYIDSGIAVDTDVIIQKQKKKKVVSV